MMTTHDHTHEGPNSKYWFCCFLYFFHFCVLSVALCHSPSSMVPSVPFCRAPILLCNSPFFVRALPSFHSLWIGVFVLAHFVPHRIRVEYSTLTSFFCALLSVKSFLLGSRCSFCPGASAYFGSLVRLSFWSWIENHLRHSFGMRPNATTLSFTERWLLLLLLPLQIFGIRRNATTQYTNERASRRQSSESRKNGTR